MKYQPIHPGEILTAEFLEPLALSQTRLARELGIPARRVNEICRGKRAVSADTALRLARFFGMSAAFWMNLQARFDLERADDRFGAKLKREIRPMKRAA